MLQTSTTDSEFDLFPSGELSLSPTSTLSEDDHAFYNSIKEELNKLSSNPSEETIGNILKYSRSL